MSYHRLMRAAIAAAMVVMLGCGASAAPDALPTRTCAPASYFDGVRCQPRSRAKLDIERGRQALREFLPDRALTHLQRAERNGPHRYEDLVIIYEQLGIAYGYLDREAESVRAFDRLLALAPNHLLPYSLGPKATERYEKARKKALARRPAELDVSWPRKLRVGDAVPLQLELIANPSDAVSRAVIHIRRAGSSDYGDLAASFATESRRTEVVVPAFASDTRETLELFVSGYDNSGNEVLRWSSAAQPREILLAEPPPPWYRRWQVWAGAGAAAALTTGIIIYAVTQEPPDMIPATVR